MFAVDTPIAIELSAIAVDIARSCLQMAAIAIDSNQTLFLVVSTLLFQKTLQKNLLAVYVRRTIALRSRHPDWNTLVRES